MTNVSWFKIAFYVRFRKKTMKAMKKAMASPAAMKTMKAMKNAKKDFHIFKAMLIKYSLRST